MLVQNKAIVLIVEDRPEVTDLWIRHLEPLDMEIRVASTMAEAKAIAIKIPPIDLLLLDLRLADSNDEATLRSIRELTVLNPDCRVLVLSGYITPDLTKLAIEQGAHSVLEKLDIRRANDLWQNILKTIRNSPKGVQERMGYTAALIEKLGKALLL